MSETIYQFFSDGGHGWLQVPIKDLIDLKIKDKISHYSYIKDDKAYLEEDCDAGIFVLAYRNAYGKINIEENNCNGSSIIRTYRQYSNK